MRHLIAPLFVPATRPDRFEKAARSGADAIIIDLEDAVPPAHKEEARSHVAAGRELAVPVVVRVNPEGTPWYEQDVQALADARIGLVCLPKAEDLSALDRLISILGPSIGVMALIETARGVEKAAVIAGHPAVRQLAFGPADFFLELGIPVSREMTGHVLRRLAIASRAAGIAAPLDGPCFGVGHLMELQDECSSALASGAGGKLCIHPSQPAHVQECFAPRPEEVEWARRVIAADRDGGAQIVGGKMIDAPVVARARAILERLQFVPPGPAKWHNAQRETE